MKLTPNCVRLPGILLLIINVLIINVVLSQSNSDCAIGVGMEPVDQSAQKATAFVKEIYSPNFVKWSDLGNIKLSDDKKATILLANVMRSRQIMGNNLQFKIPPGSTINGITLMVEGQSEKFQNIDEVEILLLGADGEPKGQNKNNTAKLQKAWSIGSGGNDHIWMYGHAKDTWGTNWTAEEINDANFGYQIQIRNIDVAPIKIWIDQIQIIVDYTPPFSFCDDKCLTFYVDKYENYGSYAWYFPDGFRMVSATAKLQTLDLKITTATYGVHKLCVDVFDYSGRFVNRCCRNILYQNCTSASISGLAWSDNNNSQLRDADDGILSGVSVILYSENGIPLDSAFTDGFGKYQFTNLANGNYYLKVPQLADMKQVFFTPADLDKNSDITNAKGPGTTDIISLSSGSAAENIDFGYLPLVTIGDFVWTDSNYNGLQDSNEKGISGVKVKLYQSNGIIVDSVFTDSNGKYHFAPQPASKYYVVFDKPAGCLPTFKKSGISAFNSKIDADGKTQVFDAFTPGKKDDIDAGFYKPSVLGDLVWEDKNGDGLYNQGERGLGGIIVTLTGKSGDGDLVNIVTITNQSGFYTFINLKPGMYNITFTAPGGYYFTIPNAGDDAIDSDAIDGVIENILVRSGDVNINLDAGMYRTGSISNFVWHDLNGNGIQDIGEKGIWGVTVTLREIRRDGIIVVATQITDANGNYIFDNLAPGKYTLTFGLTDGYHFTTSKVGTDTSADSDPNDAGIVEGIMLMSGEQNDTYDAGLFRYASIGDFVWEDLNGNGIQDAGEPGIAGVSVELTGITGAGESITQSMFTTDQGFYTFEGLKPGRYSLFFDLPEGFVFTGLNIGIDPAVDSDVSEGKVLDIDLQSGQKNDVIDAGIFKKASLGDFVWNDLNANGIQDQGEPGLADVSVHLEGVNGLGDSIAFTTTSDNNGQYFFADLEPGNYTISVTKPLGYEFTIAGQGSDTNLDSDSNDGVKTNIVLVSGEVDYSIDFGFVGGITLGDFVWNDINANGIQDIGEPGLEGIKLVLEGIDYIGQAFSDETVTDTNGNYKFSGVLPGSYTITVNVPDGFIPTLAMKGNDPNKDSNLSENQNNFSFSVIAGLSDNTIDFGLVKLGSIGDLVWEDMNCNGVQDTGEPGFAGVTIHLEGLDMFNTLVQKSTVTDDNGHYLFENLKPGEYVVIFDIPDGYEFSAAMVNMVNLLSGQAALDLDAPLFRRASLGDFVWNDLNQNGLQDFGEPGLGGVVLNLTLLNSTMTWTTTTDSLGYYRFENLKPGRYAIDVETPDGYKPTLQNVGTDTSIDSDIDDDAQAAEITLISGQNNVDVDAGFVTIANGSIGDFVWEDMNGNGVQDIDEPGIPDVAVIIQGTTVSGKAVNLITVTNQSGWYIFEKLEAGTYTLTFVKPDGYMFTVQGAGLSDTDSDANGLTGFTNEIILTFGNIRYDIDAGFYRYSSIGDFLWDDINSNGLQDEGEPGLGGVVLKLTLLNSTMTWTTTTDSLGYYRFENLKPGRYAIDVETPDGYKPTLQNVGTDTSIDSDIDNDAQAAEITLISGQNKVDVDAGFVTIANGSIGDFVWDDMNGNGVQDIDEPGIPDVAVIIQGTTVSGKAVNLTTVTNQSGWYIFEKLEAGSYTVSFTAPEGYMFTSQGVGSSDVDSDADALTGTTNEIILTAGGTRYDIDAGFYRYASVGDFVWHDLNKDGLQSDDEPGVGGAVFRLLDEAGAELASTVSDANGYYAFTNVSPGLYKIIADLPQGYLLTVTNNSNNLLNSDFAMISGEITTTPLLVISGSIIQDIDLGLIQKVGSISGTTWTDTNSDGIYNSNESPISGIVVYLLNIRGDTLRTDTTDMKGLYGFGSLVAGQYEVKFGNPDDQLFTFFSQGADPEIDSDVINKFDGSTGLLSLMQGQDLAGINAGYVGYSSLGDFAWVDENGNGLQDLDEPGLNGIKIRLFNSAGIVADSVLTSFNPSLGKSGYYTFEKIPYDDYVVEFALPENFRFADVVSTDQELNSNVTQLSIGFGRTEIINLRPDQHRRDIDAGYVLLTPVTGTIKGVVWKDSNNNKLRENNETLLSGVSLTLKNLSGTVVATSMSGLDGAYEFSDIPFGDYYISAPLETDQLYVLYSGQPQPFDSDISNDFGLGTTRILTLFPGETLGDIDLGYALKVTIGDFVWDDLDNNGLQDIDEPGIGGIRIQLNNEQGVTEQTVFSDTDGNYTFDNVAQGKFRLTFAKKDGYVFATKDAGDPDLSSKADPNTGITALLDFTAAQQYNNIDAGYVKAGSIGDKVWLDLNSNGIFQAGEPGIANIKVKLYTTAGILIDSTVTGPAQGGNFVGFYIFNNVRPGSYFLKFDIPDTYLLSPSGIGGADNDSNITEANGPRTTDTFSVGIGENILNIYAGAYIPAVLGDFVWNDLNKNGVQDAGEPGVQDITVKLFTQTGQLLETIVTDSQGKYFFKGLRQRLYYLQFSIPDGFEFTLQNASGNGATDSDVDQTGTTPLISLAHGSTFLDVDAGIFSSTSRLIMGTVWNDTNNDGIRNPNETLMKNIKVYLKNNSNVVVASCITNHAGMYSFSVQQKGEFYIYVELPDDHVFTKKHFGPDHDIDSDVNDDGISDMLMLDDNYKMNYIDAGCYFKVSGKINGVVWKDKNRNGLRDPFDELMSDVVIFIFNNSRVFIKSTKTDKEGKYSLKNLDSGQYYCKVPEYPELDFILFTGENQDYDSEITNQYGKGTSRLITIQAGTPINNFDFGYKPLNGVSSSDKETGMQLEVYPNPTISDVRIGIPESDTGGDYFIFNSAGSLVMQGKVNARIESIHTEDLPTGRYTIKVVSGDNNWVKSFMKLENR